MKKINLLGNEKELDKEVLMSIQPRHLNNILIGRKKLELRKTSPRKGTYVYLYCTKGEDLFWKGHKLNGKIAARFRIKDVFRIRININERIVLLNGRRISEKEFERISCVTLDEANEYYKGKDGKAIFLEELEILEVPAGLETIRKECIYRTPKCYSCKLGYPICHEDNYEQDGLMSFFDEHCYNYLKKVPQSWCYIYSYELGVGLNLTHKHK